MTAIPVLSPLLAARTIAFLWGLQFSFLTPALALLLVSLFGASTGQVAVVLAIYNGAALVTSWAIPRWADRHGEYVRGMFGCAGFTVALSVALTFARSLPAGVIGLVLLGAPAAVGTPLLFGFVRHSGAPPAEVVRVRAFFSTAWVAGPPLASAVIAGGGGHALVLSIGGVGVANLVVIGALHRTAGTARPVPAAEPARPEASRRTSRTAVVLLVAAFAGLQATNSSAVAVTTLFVTQTLHLSPLWGGIALGVAAGLEVPFLLLIGRNSGRIDDLTLLGVAGLLGIAYYLGVSVAPNGYTLVALQLLNAGFYAVIAGVGLTLFQSIIAGPAAAAGLLSNAQRIGALLSGPIIGVSALLAGSLRAVFVTGAVLTLVSLGLVRLAARRLPPADVTTGIPR